MRVGRWAWMFVALVAGCEPSNTQYGYDGYAMADFFPFDGERTWTFVQEGVEHHLEAKLNTAFATVEGDNTRIYDVDYSLVCPEGSEETCTPAAHRFSKIRWSAGSGDGALIHGIVGENGEQTFDPPIALTDDRGSIGSVVTTETGGATFIGRFDDIVPCPISYTDEWEQCIKVRLDDDDDAATPGNHPLHGDYYAVAGYNIVAMQLTDDAALWELYDTTYAEAE